MVVDRSYFGFCKGRRRRLKSSTRFTSSVSFHLKGCVTFLFLSSSLAANAEVENIQVTLLRRRIDTVVYVDSSGNLTNASVLPNVNYSSFFDDDSVTTDSRPVSKSIPFPSFLITLQLGSLNASTYSDLSTDLDNTMTNYLLKQVVDRMSSTSSSTTVTSLSLDIHRMIRRYIRSFKLPTSVRLAVQSLPFSVTFQGNGTVSIVSPTNVFQTNTTVLIQTINSAVESCLSDSTALIAYIYTHASTPSLQSVLGVSTSVNGQVYSSLVSKPSEKQSSGMNVKRIICQTFGYALIAIAGFSAFGWIYLFYLRYDSQKQDAALVLKANRFQQKTKATNSDTKNDLTDASSVPYERAISKRKCTPNSLQVSRTTTHEELSDESYRDDSLLGGDQDDDSFGMQLQKAILMDQSSGQRAFTVKAEKTAHFNHPPTQTDGVMRPSIPTLIPPPRQGSTNRIMYTLSKSRKDIQEEEDIPDPVDLDNISCSSSSEYREESPISYFQISTQSSSQYVELIRDSPKGKKSESHALNFAFKTRRTTSTDRLISKDEYDAAVDAAAFQIKKLSSGTSRGSIEPVSSGTTRACNKKAINCQPIDNNKSDVRDYLVAKLSSLINKLDPVDPTETEIKDINERQVGDVNSSLNDDCMSDNDTWYGTASTSGPSIGIDPNRRLGIHPISSKSNTFQPPPSITMKRILRDISKRETAQIPSSVPPIIDQPSTQAINENAQSNMNSGRIKFEQRITERSTKQTEPAVDSSTTSISASAFNKSLPTQQKDEKSNPDPSSSVLHKSQDHSMKTQNLTTMNALPYTMQPAAAGSEVNKTLHTLQKDAISSTEQASSAFHQSHDWKFKTAIEATSNERQPSTVQRVEFNSMLPSQVLNTDPTRIILAVSTENETMLNPTDKNIWKNKRDYERRSEPARLTPKKKDSYENIYNSESMIDNSSNVSPSVLRHNGAKLNREQNSPVIKRQDLDTASTSPLGKLRKQHASEVSLYAIQDIVSPSNIIQQSGVRPSVVKAAAESLKRSQSRFKDPKSWMSTTMDSTGDTVSGTVTPSPETPPRVPSPLINSAYAFNRPNSPLYASTPPQVTLQMNNKVKVAQDVLRSSATKLIEKFELRSNRQFSR